MKVTIYMAISADGYVAKLNGETPWSSEEWNEFSQKVKTIKNIIIGRKTFEIMQKEKEFEKIGNPLIVVVSNTKEQIPDAIVVQSPKEALQIIKEKNFSEALIAGGTTLNSSFLKEQLVDELILDIEPIIFGKGIPLFKEVGLNIDLQLLNTRKYSEKGTQLRCQIAK